jgi:hypothetical protein
MRHTQQGRGAVVRVEARRSIRIGKFDDGRFTPLPPCLQPRPEALHTHGPPPRSLTATQQHHGWDALSQVFGSAKRLLPALVNGQVHYD